jgi:murein DD-endopeptidase MepM/ murein hydrolase activator NlpD
MRRLTLLVLVCCLGLVAVPVHASSGHAPSRLVAGTAPADAGLPGTLQAAAPLPLWSDPVPAPTRQGAWPLSPRPGVVSGFDPPATRWGAGHRGVDLLGRAGQPVHASLGGTVTFARTLAGRGVVVVDHGTLRTTYEPVSARVAVGDVVGRGQEIGTLQHTSSHCLPRACLHWGLRRGEDYLDPLTLVGAGPVRLLPPAGWSVSVPDRWLGPSP